jgi:hypothetical protein
VRTKSLKKLGSCEKRKRNQHVRARIDGNNAVGLSDLVALAQHYGQHYPQASMLATSTSW